MRARDLIFSLLASAALSSLAIVAYETSLHAELYARLQDPATEDARHTLSALSGKTEQTFTRRPFAEAVAEFQRAVPMPAAEWRALEDEHKARGFTMARTASMGVLRDAHQSICDGLASGTTKRDVMGQLRDAYTNGGETDPGHNYLELVYDNAVLKSYGGGRWAQMTHPDVLRLRPFWQYRTRRDGKVRPAHQALDRKTFAANAPFWQRWFPPNGHRCRCGVDTLSAAQVQEQGITVDTELPKQIEVPGHGVVQMIPEPGWGGSPATAHTAEAVAAKVERAVEREPLLGRDPEGLVRDDAARRQVIEAASGLSATEARAQLAETPRFSVHSSPPSAPPAGAAHVDWHAFSQNTDGVKQLVTRAVEEPGLFALRDRIAVVPRVTFEAAVNVAERTAPELVWLGETSAASTVDTAATEVALRFNAQLGELPALTAFLETNGERQPGASPVKYAPESMDAELVLGAGAELPEGIDWRPAVRHFRQLESGRWLSRLARTRQDGWDQAIDVLVNGTLWSRLG